MPANYVLLEKITVGAAGASSVTFSGIPQTGYTDLVVKITGRSTRVAVQDYVKTSFNGVTTNLSMRQLYVNGGSPASSAETEIYTPGLPGASATANTFGNVEIYIPNYTSANYKSVSIDGVLENNAVGAYLALDAGLWSDTAAITSVVLTPYFGSFVQYSTFYLYGVAKLGTTPAISPYATGGDTIMTDGTYWYHTFISSGTFTPAVGKNLSCDYLVVAGGGGGGGALASSPAGGGGGAGGFLTSTAYSAPSGTGITVTVGAGGAGGLGSVTNGARGASGSNSVFGTITSTGGGGGSGTGQAATSGGSGGGGAGYYSGQNLGGAASPSGQGNTGGNTTGNLGGGYQGGAGGGGAGSVGANTTTGNNSGGAGGSGTSNSYSGSSVSYAGGGGGGAGDETATPRTAGTATSGGGAGGAIRTNGTAATANLGGGGGGAGGNQIATQNGGNGGSGIVLVRYLV